MDKETFEYEKSYLKAIEKHVKEHVAKDRMVRVITPLRVTIAFVVTLAVTIFFNGL